MKYISVLVILIVVFIGYLLFFNKKPSITNYPSSGTSIVAFGDSLIFGVGASEGNDFVSILANRIGEPIINLGISGNTTADGLERIDTVTEQNPKVVMILLGGNDYLQKIPADETFNNLRTIIEKIHKSGSTVILLGVRGGILRDNFQNKFKDLAKEKNVAYVSDVLDDLIGNNKFMSDSIHPNDAGYLIIANRVQPVLESLLE